MLNTKFSDLSSDAQQLIDELAADAGYESFADFFEQNKEQFDAETFDSVECFDAIDLVMQAFPEGE